MAQDTQSTGTDRPSGGGGSPPRDDEEQGKEVLFLGGVRGRELARQVVNEVQSR